MVCRQFQAVQRHAAECIACSWPGLIMWLPIPPAISPSAPLLTLRGSLFTLDPSNCPTCCPRPKLSPIALKLIKFRDKNNNGIIIKKKNYIRLFIYLIFTWNGLALNESLRMASCRARSPCLTGVGRGGTSGPRSPSSSPAGSRSWWRGRSGSGCLSSPSLPFHPYLPYLPYRPYLPSPRRSSPRSWRQLSELHALGAQKLLVAERTEQQTDASGPFASDPCEPGDLEQSCNTYGESKQNIVCYS